MFLCLRDVFNERGRKVLLVTASDLVGLEPTAMPFAGICSTTENHLLTYIIAK